MPKPMTKALLKTGEPRVDYIRRRIAAGATNTDILGEINSPELYSGPPGKAWLMSLVAVERRVMRDRGQIPAEPIAAAPAEPEPEPIATGAAALSDDDIAELKRVARERVQKRERERVKAELLKQFEAEEMRRAARAADSGKELVTITIDSAECQPYICLDIPHGVMYLRGGTYEVTRERADTLREIIARGWDQEEQIHGDPKGRLSRRMVTEGLVKSMKTGAEIRRIGPPGLSASQLEAAA